MSRHMRKFFSVLIVFALLLQPFAPLAMARAEAPNQKAQIEKAVADYQKTYDDIMAIKECELETTASIVIDTIDAARVAWKEAEAGAKAARRAAEDAARWIRDNAVAPVAGVLAWGADKLTGGAFDLQERLREHENKQRAKEAEARKLELEAEKKQKEEEDFKKYGDEIDEANEQIKQIKADAQKTMDLLKKGDFEAAAKTDPSQVHGTMDAGANALRIYQDALIGAGQKLVSTGEVMSKTGAILGVVSLTLKVIAAACAATVVAAPAAGIISSISGVCDIAGKAVGIASVVLIGAGNSLIEAGEKGITSDREYAVVIGKNTAKAAASEAIKYGTKKITGGIVKEMGGGAFDEIADGDFATQAVKSLLSRGVGNQLAPSKTQATGVVNSGIDSATDALFGPLGNDRSDEEPLPEASRQPGLGGGSW
ncbi:MAG: hypothetical protein CVV41_01180 [Candidatus Riflebacteria bacterium HGW-Riflebacteria-1]|nr:MAG: hypothetical protein CVV41_01180 [Candidatus Riflebacteria bacterium HGW-Riflebacteria-1]